MARWPKPMSDEDIHELGAFLLAELVAPITLCSRTGGIRLYYDREKRDYVVFNGREIVSRHLAMHDGVRAYEDCPKPESIRL